jgi:predicted DNA binding CopG/RHH family protein
MGAPPSPISCSFGSGEIRKRIHCGTGKTSVLIRNPPSRLHSKSLAVAALLQDMLHAMQQTAAPAPSAKSQSFAGLLAALAAPIEPGAPRWSDEGLADDYATLSYERALRSHARYHPSDAPLNTDDLQRSKPVEPDAIHIREVLPGDAPPARPETSPRAASPSIADVHPETTHSQPSALDRNLKSSSITIRLSKAESVQLRKRAAEAGLSVSAYLRSCTFEAETLRTLVKDTLAQLHSDPSKRDQPVANQLALNPAATTPARRSLRQLWARFRPQTQAHHIAQA